MRLKNSILIILSSALVACGGGGSESNSNSIPDAPTASISYPVDAVFSSFFGKEGAYRLTASDQSGNSYVLTFSSVPASDKIVHSLSSTPLKVAMSTASLSMNGGTPVVEQTETYYTVSPFLIWGSYTQESGVQNLIDPISTRVAPPSNAMVGNSGPLGSGHWHFYTPSKSLYWSPLTITWSLESDTASSAWLCINSSTSDLSGLISESNCARINQSGLVLGFKATVRVNGRTLSFT